MTVPTIMCAVCGHQVERVVLEHCLLRCGYRIKAQCHGDQDEMFLTDYDIVDEPTVPGQIMGQVGVAFQDKLLPPIASSAQTGGEGHQAMDAPGVNSVAAPPKRAGMRRRIHRSRQL